MQIRIAVGLALVISTRVFAGDSPKSYAGAKAIWEQSKDTTAYQTYAAEFSQFNNHFHLDEKGGCYGLAPGPVDLMLVITHPDNGEFAVIEQVLSDVDNAKTRCFKRSYGGIRTKIPPFFPFVLQMTMG
jgi:hypothetical protein